MLERSGQAVGAALCLYEVGLAGLTSGGYCSGYSPFSFIQRDTSRILRR